MSFATNLAQKLCRSYPLKSGAGTISNSKVIKFLERGTETEEWVDVFGGQAFVPTRDYVGRAMKFCGDLDPKISDVVDRVLVEGNTCLDIGANLGLVSLRMAKNVGANGRVHSFEPQPGTLKYFRETLSRRACSNIVLHEVALGNSRGTLKMSVPDGNAGAATLKPDEQERSRTISVETTTLDFISKSIDVDLVALVKLDVEGFELEVLKGGREFFDTSRAVLLFEEHGYRPNTDFPESFEFLSAMGYEIYALPKTYFSTKVTPLDFGHSAHDFVAVSPRSPDSIRERLAI